MLTRFILIYLIFKQDCTLFYICHVQATTKTYDGFMSTSMLITGISWPTMAVLVIADYQSVNSDVFSPAAGDPLSCPVYFKPASARLLVISKQARRLQNGAVWHLCRHQCRQVQTHLSKSSALICPNCGCLNLAPQQFFSGLGIKNRCIVYHSSSCNPSIHSIICLFIAGSRG